MMQQLPAFVVNRATAMRARTKHQFIEGMGYIAHEGPPDLPPTANGKENCDPAQGTADATIHLLQPPYGHPPMQMRWLATERAWASLKPSAGNRLAWPTWHLSKAGWKYLKAA